MPNFKLGMWIEDDDPHQPQVSWPPKSKVKVTWSVWAVLAQWPTNQKQLVVVSPKLAGGTPMTHATFRISFKVKRWKIRVTDRLTQTHKMCHLPNGKA